MWKKSIAVCVLLACSNSLAYAAPCDDADLLCIKRELGKKAEEALSLARELATTNQQLDLERQKSAALASAYTQLKETVPGLTRAIEAVRPRWYESPWLWLGVGVLLGGLTVIVGVAALGQLAGSLVK